MLRYASEEFPDEKRKAYLKGKKQTPKRQHHEIENDGYRKTNRPENPRHSKNDL
jgi:hypothetical protein